MQWSYHYQSENIVPVRIGIVGAGEAAREIANVLISIVDARVIAICDRDLSRAESLARRVKARAFRDAKSMMKPPTKRKLARQQAQRKSEETKSENAQLENAQSENAKTPVTTGAILQNKSQKLSTNIDDEKLRTLDAVLISSSERNKSEAISLALQSGCEVFVVSPLAFSLDGAQKITEFAHDNRARIWTSHTIRFSSSAEHARKLLTARDANVSSLHGSWKIDNINAPGKAARDNAVLTSSTRCVDALRFMCGEIKSVYARSSIGVITLSIEFANGVVGAMVLGEDCENVLHFQMSNQRLEWRENAVVIRRDAETQHIEYSNGALNAQKNELRAWLQSVESGRRTLAKSKPEDTIQNLRVALAIVQSIKTNKPVRLGV